ncbi:MAG: leucyl aminopeptidase family protein [Planctomycetota bacterium]
MRISVSAKLPSKIQAQVWFLLPGGKGPPGIAEPLREALNERLQHSPCAVLPSLGLAPTPFVALVKMPNWSDAVECRRRGGAIARLLAAERCVSAALHVPTGSEPAKIEPLLIGFDQGSYAWDRYQAKPTTRVTELTLIAPGGWIAVAKSATVMAGWIAMCRDLINAPAADLGPDEFEAEARWVAKNTGLRLRVLDEDACARFGMGCLLAVGRASPRRPRMLVLELPGTKSAQPLALCGKGVCFDTGGLNIKPADGMLLMRKDMGGAATVLCALAAAAAHGRPTRTVRAYLPLVENSISGNAFRPGDVLKAMDGTTVEIANTDAEGRLILADAVCLARKEGAGTIISVATLTGAAMTALGRIHVPLMTSDDGLAQSLLASALKTGEKMWRLPMDAEHRALNRGQVAQLTNAPSGGEAGCITAGAFVAHFAGDVPFAHLDISPTCWMAKAWELGPVGATGTAVTTLTDRILE